jgi:hypothetical protein
MIRAAYLALEAIGWLVLVPLSLVSLLTGLIQSLGTPWGLVRHYWVLFKLLINVVASVFLLMYMQTLGFFAGAAGQTTASSTDLDALRSPSPALHAGVALMLLVAAATLSVYKPRGLKRYGRRKHEEVLAMAP